MLYKQSPIKLNKASDKLDELERAIHWFEEQGLNVAPTRVAKYKKHLAKVLVTESPFEKGNDFEHYILMAKEIDELLKVFNVFKNHPNEALVDKYKKIISGKLLRKYVEAEDDDKSRDYLHELFVAAGLLVSGKKVDITGVCDVVAYDKGQEIYIECKRIKSISQLEKRVKEADAQIKKRVGIKKLDKSGFITLDLTSVLMSENIEVYNDFDDVTLNCMQKLKGFSHQYREKIQNKTCNKIRGVLLCFHVSGVIKNDDLGLKPFHCSFNYLLSFAPEGSPLHTANKAFFEGFSGVGSF